MREGVLPLERKDAQFVFQLTIWSLPPLLAAVIALIAYQRSAPSIHTPGGFSLRFLFVCLFYWSAAQTIGSLVKNPDTIELAAKLAYLGIVLTPVAWLLFAITYSQRVIKLSRRAVNAALLLPLITFSLAMTNDWHGWIWTKTHIITIDGFRGMLTTHGFWFYVHAVYSYSIVLAGTAILTFSLLKFKQHYQALLAAVFAPLIGIMANLFYLSPLNNSPWFDITVLGFLAGVIILDRGILQHGLLNRVPVPRDNVVELLNDPVLVITNEGKIVDSNQSALEAWESPTEPLLNASIDRLLSTMPKDRFLETHDGGENNVEVTIDGSTYEVSTTALDGTNPCSDVALLFRDITARLKAENELRQVKDELERMAHTDALTGMFNRRYFMQRLGEEFERLQRHGSVLSVLIFDLDHFKKVNDTYGHDAGDAVLVSVSEVVNDVKRLTDIACRLGGEEFALLLPETDKTGAINLAQRLRKGIEAYDYGATVGSALKVTVSVGVATVGQRTRQPENVLKVADRALYKAKNSGRNMVCVDDDL